MSTEMKTSAKSDAPAVLTDLTEGIDHARVLGQPLFNRRQRAGGDHSGVLGRFLEAGRDRRFGGSRGGSLYALVGGRCGLLGHGRRGRCGRLGHGRLGRDSLFGGLATGGQNTGQSGARTANGRQLHQPSPAN